MKHFAIFLLPLLVFASCGTNSTIDKKDLIGTWRLSDMTADTIEITFDKKAELNKTVSDGYVLNIFNDENFSIVEGSGVFNSGKWDYKPREKFLRFHGSGKIDFDVLGIEKGKNDRQILSVKSNNLLLKFTKAGEPLKTNTEDPFYPENNKWRIRSKTAEDSIQLRKRMANYFKHLALILKSSQERKQGVVSFEFSQGPVKIYSSGIGILPYEEVNQNWKNCFYSEENAVQAYMQFQNYLKTNKYKGAGTGDWVEDDYNILLSIYSGFN